MSGLDVSDRFDPKELLTPEIRNAIQIGSNGIVRDYWNNFFVFLTCFTAYDDMVCYGDQNSQVQAATRLMNSARDFTPYNAYLARVAKFRFPQLTSSDAQDMLEYLCTLSPHGTPPPGPQLDELSQRFRAEIQEGGVAEDIPRLRAIVSRYESTFRAFFPRSLG